MERTKEKIRKIISPICKIAYYTSMIWVIIVCTVGTYKVFENLGSEKEVISVEYELSEYKKKELLEKEVAKLYYELDKRYSVTLYKVTFETAYEPELVDIIANEGDPYVNKQEEYWKEQANFKGYAKLNFRIRNEKVVYIENVKEDLDVYKGRTKIDIDNSGIKEIYGLLIQEKPKISMTAMVLASADTIDIASVEFYLNTRQSAKNIGKILKE